MMWSQAELWTHHLLFHWLTVLWQTVFNVMLGNGYKLNSFLELLFLTFSLLHPHFKSSSFLTCSCIKLFCLFQNLERSKAGPAHKTELSFGGQIPHGTGFPCLSECSRNPSLSVHELVVVWEPAFSFNKFFWRIFQCVSHFTMGHLHKQHAAWQCTCIHLRRLKAVSGTT